MNTNAPCFANTSTLAAINLKIPRMITDKKNQHYIPKFYLRNFSFQNNKKQIGLFNITNEFLIKTAKLKTQGSKNFYYGSDGVIEDKLSNIETELARLIQSIITNRYIPLKSTTEHSILLLFVAVMEARNPVNIEGNKIRVEEMRKRFLEMFPEPANSDFIPDLTHDESIRMSFSALNVIMQTFSDLEYKLLLNETKRPFITSDFPIIKYNQFLESRNWKFAKTGYASVGLQIFLPLNSELAIVFFDQGVYKVGTKKQRLVALTYEDDVDSLNILQFINCFDTVFFNEKADELYIKGLYQKSKLFKRANIPTATIGKFFVKGDFQVRDAVELPKQDLIVMASSDCETNLQINGIKIHSKGSSYKLSSSIVQIRPSARYN
jgi:Protein of unknown function (DUF4238)